MQACAKPSGCWLLLTTTVLETPSRRFDINLGSGIGVRSASYTDMKRVIHRYEVRPQRAVSQAKAHERNGSEISRELCLVAKSSRLPCLLSSRLQEGS